MDYTFFDDKRDCTDSLTHVYNREVTFSFINSLISENRPFSVCILDVDNFKYVNDGYGHQVGDRALYEISRRIEEILGDNGVVGRFGGDEFIIVLPDKQDYDEIWEIYHNLNSCTKKLKSKDLNNISMTVTMGSARFPLDATNLDGLFELADKALYRGKMKGRNCFIIYLPEKHANINLKTERDKVVSSTYLHNLVYRYITDNKELKKGINNVFDYFVDYFMIDHLCLQDDEKMYCECQHPLCRNTPFYPLPYDELKNHFIGNSAVFTKNVISEDDKSSKVLTRLLNDGIYSIFYVRIKYKDKLYGYLRADLNNNDRGRIWQSLHKDILQVIANYIALELHSRGIELKDL